MRNAIYDAGFRDGSIAGYELAKVDISRINAADKERDQLRELCGELLIELKGLYENVSFQIHQEHRNLVKSVIAKAEKALGGSDGK